ncbi:RDD family protein [Ideonella sp. DXS22W]|uniref:RDD family protein n=1 Tax=Pseudaquabacterium inlustre TaxID=2984192 RepID=A0ABU9CG93_9BURK
MTQPADAGAGPAAPGAIDFTAPTLRRRMAAFLYEGVLLFGVLMIAGYLYSSLTQQRHALQGKAGLQAFLFVVLGIYFTWFWSRGGQTVAMKAWHVRLVDAAGAPVSQARAFARYLLSWLWFLPALLAVWLADLHGGGVVSAVLMAGVAGYASLAFLRPDRQFWHDAVCGTRLITWRPARPTRSAQAQSQA